MLVLSRKHRESVVINGFRQRELKVTVVGIKPGKVLLGFEIDGQHVDVHLCESLTQKTHPRLMIDDLLRDIA